MTKRNPFSEGKLLTHGSGIGLVPAPKRSGKAILCIFGPGNIVIGSGVPRHIAGDVSCPPNRNDRLSRTERNIKASFIIVTSDNTSAACYSN
jgi:hypothetical protein